MYDFTVELDPGSERCLYEQIYDYIKQEMKEGKLLMGEKLPSTRSLAEKLQVARSTVEFAYEQLLSEGYIESRPYRGYYVCALEELLVLEEKPSGSAPKAQGVKPVYGRGGEAVKKSPENAKADSKIGTPVLCDFSPTGIDMSQFPFSVWKKLTKDVLSDSNNRLFLQGSGQGEKALRETISRYLHSSRGVNCTPEQIIIGAGNDYLLMLLEKILGRHVRIAMENPTYKRAYEIFGTFAYPTVTIDMDQSGMVTDKLQEADVKVAYVMPSHQYPTGVVMPINRRMELLNWALQEEDRYLIEDDYDSEFRYKGKPIPSLQASDVGGKVIYMGTFSKSIAPAIRVSYMVLPPALLEVYREKCSCYSSTVSRIDQRILDSFIREGYFERYLNKMRKYYKEKHDVLLAELEEFRKDFTITGENAGLHVLLTCRSGLTEAELIKRALDAGVKVYGLSESLVEPQERHTVLLGYGGLTTDEIIKGTGLLRQAWL